MPSTRATPSATSKTALLSVYDKTGVDQFAAKLSNLGYRLVATGGTYRKLSEAGLDVVSVSELTGSPEILGGRVKTLHPVIHGGILAKREDDQLAELAAHDIATIDVVAVNLYPFREVVQAGADVAEALENIDIGGPTMLRAAAKNFPSVVVVSNPNDYDEVISQLEQDTLDTNFRQQLAVKAFAHVSAYDAAITLYLNTSVAADLTEMGLEIQKLHDLRYGENPHQNASLWRFAGQRGPILDAEILQGKAMSFNNYQDADAAWELLNDISKDGKASAVALKHTNPCGVAQADRLIDAYQNAHDADPKSIFGGIVAVSDKIGKALAARMCDTFLELVIAPDYSEDALEVFANKKNLRLLKITVPDKSIHDLRKIRGGLLIQDRDTYKYADAQIEVVSKQQPERWEDLELAWHIVKHAKSNAIVIVKDGMTFGIGASDVSRIGAARRALMQAGEKAQGAVLASDAFFPFDDVVRQAASCGVHEVISPGGSIRDDEVIAACDETGMAMVFTGVRHFKH